MTKPQNEDELGGSQFSIRQLLIVTIGVSIVCAVLATVLRSLPEKQQTSGAIFVLAVVIVGLMFLAGSFFRRASVEKKAGRSHHTTKAALRSRFHILGILSCLLSLGILSVGLLLVTGQIPTDWMFLLQGIYFLWLVAAYASNYLISVVVLKADPNSVDVRENGVVLGRFRFVPWSFIHGFKWNKFSGDLMFLAEGNFFEWKVPDYQRKELEVALEKFIPHKSAYF